MADELLGGVDACLRLGGAGFGTATEPVRLDLDAVFERVLEFGLRLHVLSLAFQELRVAAFDAKQSVGVDAVEFNHFSGDVFKEVTVVRDHDDSGFRLADELFEPGDAGEIEVVGGLVEQQDVGFADDCLGDSETLAPAAGETCGLGSERGEACAAGGFAEASLAFGLGNFGSLKCGLKDIADGEARCEDGLLADVSDTGTFAYGDVAGVGVFFTGEDLEQGRFASTVGANEADVVAIRDGEGDVVEEGCRAKGLGEALCVEDRRHCFSLPGYGQRA